MENLNKKEILDNAKTFFKTSIIDNHIKNTLKLINIDKFNINPFLAIYLAKFLTGTVNSTSIAKALIYPRVLGSSITTSFGTHLQSFCSSVLAGVASTTSGIDIEFIDQVDQRKKYCQVKAGPNTINKDDVTTIVNHFKGVINLARTNRVVIATTDMVVGVFYGLESELSSHYKKIDSSYPVYIGEEFWLRLTGDKNFYYDLINAIIEVSDMVENQHDIEVLDYTVTELAKKIEAHDMFKAYFNKVKLV